MLFELAMRARMISPLLLVALLLSSVGQAQVSENPASPDTRELQKSKDALDRARDMRASGDTRHAPLLDRLAQIWADAARDLAAAIEAEAKAQAAQKKSLELREQVENERALLEENIARRNRAQAELKRAQEELAARPPAPPPREKKATKKGGAKGMKKAGKK